MRNNRDDYRIRAELCMRMAEKSHSGEARLHWLQLAAAWKALAEHEDFGAEEPDRRHVS
jgi:hypothetical protein